MKNFILAGCGACCCFIFAITINLMLSLNFKSLLDNAEGYKEPSHPLDSAIPSTTLRRTIENTFYQNSSDGEDAYDECGGIFDEQDASTKWSQIYRYNFILYLIIACINICGCICIPCAPAILCPAFCFFLAGIPTMTAMILTGYRLKNEGGSLCSEQELAYGTGEDGTDLSFSSDADTLRKLWIA